ncbi:FecR domain-containing protein, partial [bacterium]|nr:FecR domain-containing protein [bacterium]
VLAASQEPARYRLPGAAEIALARGSRAALEQESPRVVRLLAGTAHFHVPGGEGSFEVRTALGTVSVTGTEFTVALLEEVPEMKNTKSAVAAGALVLGVGVVSGAVLLRPTDGQPVPVRAGQAAFADASGKVTMVDLPEARKSAEAIAQVATLRAALDRSSARVVELERKLAQAESERAALEKSAAARTKPAEPQAPEPLAAPELSPEDKKVAALVAKVDWAEGTKALIAMIKAQKQGKQPDPSVYVVLSKMNVAVAEISKARGLGDNPFQAYGDPLVQEQWVPAWMNALGANLDAAQTETLKKAIRDDSRKHEDPNAPPTTLLDARLHELTGLIAHEESYQRLLRPEQYASYLESVGDDPFFGHQVETRTVSKNSAQALVDGLSTDLLSQFNLSEGAGASVRAAVSRYVDEALRVAQPDASLDPPARRLALMRRTLRLIELQGQLEKSIAADPSLNADERARVAEGSPYLLTVKLH